MRMIVVGHQFRHRQLPEEHAPDRLWDQEKRGSLRERALGAAAKRTASAVPCLAELAKSVRMLSSHSRVRAGLLPSQRIPALPRERGFESLPDKPALTPGPLPASRAGPVDRSLGDLAREDLERGGGGRDRAAPPGTHHRSRRAERTARAAAPAPAKAERVPGGEGRRLRGAGPGMAFPGSSGPLSRLSVQSPQQRVSGVDGGSLGLSNGCSGPRSGRRGVHSSNGAFASRSTVNVDGL
jgi:hypothetical protein